MEGPPPSSSSAPPPAPRHYVELDPSEVPAPQVVHVPVYPEAIPPPPVYLEVVPVHVEKQVRDYEAEPPGRGGVVVVQDEGGGGQPAWDRRRRRLRLLLVLGVIVVVLAVVGGVLGGVLGSRRNAAAAGGGGGQNAAGSSQNDGGGGASSSPSATGTGTSTTTTTTPTTATPSPRPLALGASLAVRSDNAIGMTTFYHRRRAAGGLRTVYRIYVAGHPWGPESDISLPTAPAGHGTPLAVASRFELSDTSTSIQLFYLDDAGAIVLARLRCAFDAVICAVTASNAISGGGNGKVHPGSGLAAVWVPGEPTARVYYHAEDGRVAELRDDSADSTSWVSTVVGGEAYEGSNIAATYTTGPKITVFYAAKNDGLPQYVEHDGSWKNPAALDSQEPAGWSPTAQVTAAYHSELDTWRFMYTQAADAGKIALFEREGATSNFVWRGTPSQWLTAETGVAAVGGVKTFVMFCLNSGVVYQSLHNTTVWGAAGQI